MRQRHDPASASLAAASATAHSGPPLESGDALSDLLRSVRLTGSMFFLVEAARPWHSHAPSARAFAALVLPRSQHLISYHIVTQGACWGGLAGEAPVRLEAGDIMVITQGHGYSLAEPADAPPSYSTHDAVAFLEQMSAGKLPSVVREGIQGPCSTQFICGFLGCDARPFNPLAATLPPMVVLRQAARSSDQLSHLVAFAQAELHQRRAGSDEVLLRLSELMFVEVVRRCVGELADTQTGWLAGLRDPLVARALARLHREPARAWTLAALGRELGSSRSVLAERFSRSVGQPPMQYLTAWRMQLAATLLADDATKLQAVADAVGYASESAFSHAFKQMTGVAPTVWRKARAAAPRRGR